MLSENRFWTIFRFLTLDRFWWSFLSVVATGCSFAFGVLYTLVLYSGNSASRHNEHFKYLAIVVSGFVFSVSTWLIWLVLTFIATKLVNAYLSIPKSKPPEFIKTLAKNISDLF